MQLWLITGLVKILWSQSQHQLLPALLRQWRLWAGGTHLPISHSWRHFPTGRLLNTKIQLSYRQLPLCTSCIWLVRLQNGQLDISCSTALLYLPEIATRQNFALWRAELCELALALACPWKWGADLILAVQTCQWQHKIWVKYLSARFSVCLSAWIKKKKNGLVETYLKVGEILPTPHSSGICCPFTSVTSLKNVSFHICQQTLGQITFLLFCHCEAVINNDAYQNECIWTFDFFEWCSRHSKHLCWAV